MNHHLLSEMDDVRHWACSSLTSQSMTVNF